MVFLHGLPSRDLKSAGIAFVIVTPPQHGTLSGSGSDLVFSPALEFAGTDSFTFAASDGLATSLPTTVTITMAPDGDNDGIPDAWELSSFGNLAFSGGDDPNGDGKSNALEHREGSNPNDGTHALRLEYDGPNPGSGVFLLRNARSGVRYQLQASLDMENWEVVNEVDSDSSGTASLFDPAGNEESRRFYRVSKPLQ